MKLRVLPPEKGAHEQLFVDLERQARSLGMEEEADRTDPAAVIRDQLRFCLAELDGFRAMSSEQDLALLRQECSTRTEMLHMEQRTPRYSPYRFPEREKLQRRLARIEEERRRLLAERYAKRMDLLGRIQELYARHAQLRT